MIRLILFDIDGTLLDAGDLSRRSFEYVVGQFADPATALERSSFAGKTDPQIMRELLLENGLSGQQADRALGKALNRYQSYYLSHLKEAAIRPLEGARELIERLVSIAPDRLRIGILSGNLEGLVAPKLEAAGIPASILNIAAFGSDDADRNKLPAVAVQRAERLLGSNVLPSEVAIVGDTPRDIGCARHFGAVSIAIATGDYTVEQLKAANPTFVLANLLAWGEAESKIDLCYLEHASD